MNQKRTITNDIDLQKYLTPEKIKDFNKHITNYINITKELDKKISEFEKIKNIDCELFQNHTDIEMLVNLIKKN